MTLTKVQKSMAVREWNKGQTLAMVAAFIGSRSSDVEAYFKERKGYPGKIILRQPENAMPPGTPRHGTARKVAPKPAGGDNRPYVARNKSVSLVRMPWEQG